MNKAITDGITFMPEPFANGLQNYSSEDGRPGQLTYDGASNASLVAADADFGTCFETQKTETTQKLRFTGETPILQSTYLQVTVRVKAISGSLPIIRIAAWAGDSADQEVTGIQTTGTETQITSYGEVVEISAIIGPGARTGVDLAWGATPVFAHIGFDLTGPNGGVIRVDDIQVEDVSSVFIGKQLNLVDVRDFGALGDGVTDDAAAFEAADTAANGRDILVPEGVFYLGQTVTLNARVRFEGTIEMPDTARFELLKNFDFPTYAEAFDDEEEGFRRALQALFHSVDHDALDLRGRLVSIRNPVDLREIVGLSQTVNRRVIKNGQIRAESSSAWDVTEVTETASYNPNNDTTKLTGINNIASIEVGALVTGPGIGREIYVAEVDVANSELTLSKPIYGGALTQSFTFTRFRYQIDLSGFTKVEKLIFQNVNFNTRSKCSSVLLSQTGNSLIFRDCHFNRPSHRAITSFGSACSGLTLERNQFISDEESALVADRETIAVNTNNNDNKIKDNRVVRFKHFLVTSGANHIISGNHIFQGDTVDSQEKTAAIIIADPFQGTTISDNYIDNCYIEWTNEHFAFPDVPNSSFSGLTISGNTFYGSAANPWFKFISIKPYGSDHYLNGINISDNNFKMVNDTIDDAVGVDTTFADLDADRAREFTMTNNTFGNISNQVGNPVSVEITQSSASSTWSKDVGDALPFNMKAKYVTAVASLGDVETNTGTNVYDMPAITTEAGSNNTEIELGWSTNVRGSVIATVRGDRLLEQS